jgi:hypothetical protein
LPQKPLEQSTLGLGGESKHHCIITFDLGAGDWRVMPIFLTD